jgi:hypothetical protein
MSALSTTVKGTGQVSGWLRDQRTSVVFGGTTFEITVSAPGTQASNAPTRAVTLRRVRASPPRSREPVDSSPRRGMANSGSPSNRTHRLLHPARARIQCGPQQSLTWSSEMPPSRSPRMGWSRTRSSFLSPKQVDREEWAGPPCGGACLTHATRDDNATFEEKGVLQQQSGLFMRHRRGTKTPRSYLKGRVRTYARVVA